MFTLKKFLFETVDYVDYSVSKIVDLVDGAELHEVRVTLPTTEEGHTQITAVVTRDGRTFEDVYELRPKGLVWQSLNPVQAA